VEIPYVTGQARARITVELLETALVGRHLSRDISGHHEIAEDSSVGKGGRVVLRSRKNGREGRNYRPEPEALRESGECVERKRFPGAMPKRGGIGRFTTLGDSPRDVGGRLSEIAANSGTAWGKVTTEWD
jgi:hypothetical protein